MNVRRRVAIGIWALGAAIMIDLFVTGSIAWWHPYCDQQSDGPAVYAYGFPFPYREWSMVSSLEYRVMPHIFALDLVLIAAASWPILRAIEPFFARLPMVIRRSLGICGGLIVGGLVYLHVLIIAATWWPAWSIASPYERYFDYRPAIIVHWYGHRACGTYA